MNYQTLNDRFAEFIIGQRLENYDALVVSGVRETYFPQIPDDMFCEMDNDDPQFFSVYARIKGTMEVECVGDFGTHQLAREYATELSGQYGWPVHDTFAHAKEKATAHRLAAMPTNSDMKAVTGFVSLMKVGLKRFLKPWMAT